jgi:FkbM family methyltransferase
MGKLGDKKMINSYSQVGQDNWVIEMLGGKKKGFFLDVGAYDGVKFSNSYMLELNYNWSGLLIEAHPSNYKKLKSTRSSDCINCAITDSIGFVKIDGHGDTSSKISETGHKIESTTFKELFERCDIPNLIDYMSLDIEGYESTSLKEFPFQTHICSLITVEHNLYLGDDSNKKSIKETLLKNGYEIVKENVTSDGLPFEDWYKHSSLKI